MGCTVIMGFSCCQVQENTKVPIPWSILLDHMWTNAWKDTQATCLVIMKDLQIKKLEAVHFLIC